MLIYWLWLALHPELTDAEKGKLASCISDPEALFFGEAELPASPELEPLLAKAKSARSLVTAERVLEQCARGGIRVLPLTDGAYPNRLKAIADPPLVLYCRGTLPRVDEIPVIGVVGTRKASAYGLNTASAMGWQIAKCGGTVVSGMAMGIDALAMDGALRAGGQVIGVLGCGPEQIYPKTNSALFARVLEDGCILSEYPPGTPPNRWNFPRRNRIISGLSCGVLVVEAPEKSGALITAREAADQGRDVFVVPGNVDMPTFQGSNRLLRDGAVPVSSGWDVMSEYSAHYPHQVREDRSVPQPAAQPRKEEKPLPVAKKPDTSGTFDKKGIDNPSRGPYIDLNEILPRLNPDERAIVTALKDGERLVDDVIAETGLTTGKVLAAVTMLELKGILSRLPGKRVGLK